MSRWARGQAEMEAHLSARRLETIQGAATDGRRLLAEARTRLATARTIRTDPNGAFTLTYDAARLACTALLAQQGLRPTRDGGHIVVEQAMKSQFGDGFRHFGWMRRRRNEVEYPATPDVAVTTDELDDALDAAAAIIENAEQLIAHLGFFRS